ncbi:MAG: type I glyceraldehyde-3-phosphate dehydrogenase [Acidobacteriota bacterium]|jgi:glyceraldehyde 3-phosphate dehydrogenase|nr:type I glyceraldehyde-3-phosphate dehydrogenase [Acidobacteriota bacterium]
MSIKVAINGFGRIGRNFVRCSVNDPEIEVVAINDITKPETLAHLLKYDSVLGRFGKSVAVDGDKLVIGGKPVRIFSEKDPAALDWSSLGATVVVESTGKFTDGTAAKAHIKGTVKKVVISAPGKNVDGMFTMGVNHTSYDPAKHHIVSNASCTTTCLAPVVKVLDDSFGIEAGFMTTVHSYTNDQNLLDLPHKDLRRARAAASNIVPSTTGAAKAIGEILPHLKGKLDGFAIRVPTPNVSLVDLVVTVKKPASAEEVNAAFKAASEGALKGYLGYSDEPLVSSDYLHCEFSGTVDALSTKATANLVKAVAWYDNEWGYSCRLRDMVKHVAK